MISRGALEVVAETHPGRSFKNHIPSYPVSEVYDYFPIGIDARTGVYLSEDYGFSQLCTSSGLDLFLYGNTTLKHVGDTYFAGNLHEATVAVANAQAEGQSKSDV